MKPSLLLVCALLLASAPLAAGAAVPPLPTPNSTFTVGSLHVDEFGDAAKPALVFIPGLTCGPWEWSGEIARFAPDYHIYAITLPGFDGAPPIAQPLFPTVEADFWTMLAQRHIDRPVVIGHSLGGTLTIALAEEHPERLRAAVAVDGLPVFPGTDRMTPAQRLAFAQQFAASMAQIPNAAVFAQVDQKYILPTMISSPADIAAAAPLAAKSDPKASAAWALADISQDLRPGLKNITIPLLEIAPYSAVADARYFPDAGAKKAYYQGLLSGAPHANVAMVPDSLHFVMFDQPAALDRLLRDSLQ